MMKLTDEIKKEISEKIIGTTTIHKGSFLELEKIEVKLPNGKSNTREVVRHPGAVAVLAINDEGKILMEYQYRTVVDRIILEIPAGKIDKGEDIKEAALRELKEETGFIAKNIEKLGDVLLAPGYSDEIITIFLAKDLVQDKTSMDPDEFLTSFFMGKEEVLDLIKDGTIDDAKTICAMSYLLLKK